MQFSLAGIVQATIDFTGPMELELNLVTVASYTIRAQKEKELYKYAFNPYNIPDVLEIGPEAIFSVGAGANFNVAGSVLVGVKLI